jgi:hypothetical protein
MAGLGGAVTFRALSIRLSLDRGTVRSLALSSQHLPLKIERLWNVVRLEERKHSIVHMFVFLRYRVVDLTAYQAKISYFSFVRIRHLALTPITPKFLCPRILESRIVSSCLPLNHFYPL